MRVSAIAIAVSTVGLANAAGSAPLSVRDSFRIGNAGTIFCSAQSLAADPGLASMLSALQQNGAALSAISANPAAFSALANNPAALSALARNGSAFSALSNNANFRALAGNPAFGAALRYGNVANAVNQAN